MSLYAVTIERIQRYQTTVEAADRSTALGAAQEIAETVDPAEWGIDFREVTVEQTDQAVPEWNGDPF